jgi:hypothetical protein
MALIVETGAGIFGAESYASIATISTYWTNRSHMSLAATWDEATEAKQEGAAREATAYQDAVWGRFYRGTGPMSRESQGLLWPRIATDDNGFVSAGVPRELIQCTCELSARALIAPLMADEELHGQVKRKVERIGPLTEETEFLSAAEPYNRYGFVQELLAPILNGAQPGAPVGWVFH